MIAKEHYAKYAVWVETTNGHMLMSFAKVGLQVLLHLTLLDDPEGKGRLVDGLDAILGKKPEESDGTEVSGA